MNIDKFRKLLCSCFIAKKITETMQELPKGFKPRHIHVIGYIYDLSKEKSEVCISDVSNKMNITTPSVTKLINELEEKKVVEKCSVGSDKRIILVRLTDIGIKYYNYYVTEYHTLWSEQLTDVTDEQADMVFDIIEKLMKAIPKMDGLDE